jgi:predicted membrane protein
MNAWPEGTAVERFLVRVRRRMVVLRAMEGAAAGCVLASLLILAGLRPYTVPAAAILGATVIAWLCCP